MGALSPFCLCGVIPLIAALLSMGVPLAPVMAFWLASPIMDPSMFLLTSGEIGMDFAIAIAVFALVRLPVFILYLTLALTGSIIIGLIYQSWTIMVSLIPRPLNQKKASLK